MQNLSDRLQRTNYAGLVRGKGEQSYCQSQRRTTGQMEELLSSKGTKTTQFTNQVNLLMQDGRVFSVQTVRLVHNPTNNICRN